MIACELRTLVSSFRLKADSRDYVANVAHDLRRMRPSRSRLVMAMKRLRREHTSLPSLASVRRAVMIASTSDMADVSRLRQKWRGGSNTKPASPFDD